MFSNNCKFLKKYRFLLDSVKDLLKIRLNSISNYSFDIEMQMQWLLLPVFKFLF